MANKNVFTSNRGASIKPANTVNEAGGAAYDQSAESALAQYVVTGCLNGVYYASAETQVDTVLALAGKCDNEFIAKAAVYAHRVARMKDTPTLLLNVLANRGEAGVSLVEKVFPLVVTNVKMLRNFCQILRSGKCGRKSFGTALKRIVRDWLTSQEADSLFKGSVGNSPSLADVVKMVHPKAESTCKNAFYGWLLGKEYAKRSLPKTLKVFEKFKAGETEEVPSVDFRMLTALSLSEAQWSAIARQSSWNQLRMNLNTFQRHGCLADAGLVSELAAKLRDSESVRRANAFPYQLLTTFQATQGKIPTELSLAVQDALEVATQNVPAFGKAPAVCVDVSGSMQSAVTGEREGATSVTKCVDVAGLMAAAVLRQNPGAIVVPFDTSARPITLNPRDSVMTNAQRLAMNGGGTACAVALAYLNNQQWKGDLVIYVSDNQSWYQAAPSNSTRIFNYGANGGTDMAREWAVFKSRNRKAKLVCIDLQPYTTVQVQDDKDVLNVGGFSDSVFDVIANFVKNDSSNFAKVISDRIDLDSFAEEV
jgi:60 kDa SS-A/Ro ribonucleoprotein